MGIPDHLTCLLRNLYAGQEATIRMGHGTTDWFQTWKWVCQGCILSPCLFNFYAEYAGLDEAQAGIKIAMRNINNLRYADETTIMAESEEELKSVLMKVKEKSEKFGLKFNIQKTKIMANRRRNCKQWLTLFFWAPKITADGDCSHEIKRCLILGRKVMTNLDWRFVSYMILYMFQCHSLKSSHPLPLPQSPKMLYTSASLFLFRIQGYHYHLSKFHIYALVYCTGVFLSGLLHSV